MMVDPVSELERLKSQVRVMKLLLLGAVAVPILLFAVAWKAKEEPEVLRVRGLIVVDENGKERIVMGSPTPSVQNRKRKDNTSSLVFIDEDGSDRLILGENKGQLFYGKLYPRDRAYGLLIHDTKGDERGGISAFDNGKCGVALDRGRPDSDGIGMMVDDSLDFVGMLANHHLKDRRYIQGIGLGVQKGTTFLNMDDPDGNRRVSLELANGEEAKLKTWDKKGKLKVALGKK